MAQQYQVNFSYSVPEWTDITLEANDPDEAETLAKKEFEELYPEALDVEIEGVVAID